MTRESRAPLIVAIVLLLLPVLYVGSYLALVVPDGRWISSGLPSGDGHVDHYWVNGPWPERFFWPLEQIDRKVRPGAWESPWDQPVIDP